MASSRVGRNRLTGAALILVGLLSALCSAGVFTAWLPGDRALYAEFKAARVCPEGTVMRRSEDCLRQIPFTVEATSTRKKHMRATLLGPRPWSRVLVPFGDPGPVLSELRKGDRITGTVWRGVVVEIARGDDRQVSADAPRDEPQMVAAAGTFAGLTAGLALAFGGVRLVRPRDPGLFFWHPYGKALLIVMMAGCGVVGLVTVWAGLPWLLVPTICGTLLAVTACFLHRDLRRRSAGQEGADGA